MTMPTPAPDTLFLHGMKQTRSQSHQYAPISIFLHWATLLLKCTMAPLELAIHRWFKPDTTVRQDDVGPSKEARNMKRHGMGGIALRIGATMAAIAMTSPAFAAPDPGKKACAQEARKLCPAEMKSMSRKKVEACMITNIEKTSPTCKSAMLKIKAEREAGAQPNAKSQAGTSQ